MFNRQGTQFDPILRTGLGLMFGALLCTFGGCYYGMEKIRLAWSGVETDATFRVKVGKDYGGRNAKEVQHVTLFFKPEGKKTTKVHLMRPIDWEEPESGTIQITYLPSDPKVYKVTEESSTKVFLLLPLAVVLFLAGGWILVGYKP